MLLRPCCPTVHRSQRDDVRQINTATVKVVNVVL